MYISLASLKKIAYANKTYGYIFYFILFYVHTNRFKYYWQQRYN